MSRYLRRILSRTVMNSVRTMFPELLYIEFGTIDLKAIEHYFGRQLFLSLSATRENSYVKQSVWTQNNIRFIATEIKQHLNASNTDDDEYVVSWVDSLNKGNNPISGSVFNIAFKVDNVSHCVKHIQRNGGEILKPLRTLHDNKGYIETAVVKSCVGNVVHTLIDTSNYNGAFLPQFNSDCTQTSSTDDVVDQPNFTGIDHVTFALDVGHSQRVIDWYRRCFNMTRYTVNGAESIEDGFVVEIGDIGLRLKAMATESHPSSCDRPSVKFVLAESLHEHSKDQISTFLQEHGGEGVQHIGLTTNNITSCIEQMTENGIEFTEAPSTYYSTIGKLREIEEMGENAKLMEQHGILIDMDEREDNKDNSKQYLMQKFARPIFGADTFFFEVIQRKGSRGFGAGNVSALWRSFQAYLNKKQSSSNE